LIIEGFTTIYTQARLRFEYRHTLDRIELSGALLNPRDTATSIEGAPQVPYIYGVVSEEEGAKKRMVLKNIILYSSQYNNVFQKINKK
jgi:hypothetical protein